MPRARAAAGSAAALCALLAVHDAAAATSTPNDPFFANGDQWALTGSAVSIRAPAAWCAATGAGVLVADIDTGADFAHQDLQGKLVAGVAFTNGTGQESSTDVNDDTANGHGTMTTGIMVARTNNGAGIAAVAPDARALIVKVLDDKGHGYDNDIAAGIEYAISRGVRVINLSLGPDVPAPQSSNNSAIPGAIQDAYNHQVVVALAAGNSGVLGQGVSPQILDKYAMVVGATGPDGSVASYSENSGVNIFAPGGDTPLLANQTVQTSIVSTTNLDASGNPTDGYAVGDGTSFAAPQVAGVMALLLQQHPSWTATDVYDRITETARGSHPDLDAAAAVGVSDTLGCASVSASNPAAHPGGGGSSSGGTGSGAHSATPDSAGAAAAASAGSQPSETSGGVHGSTLTPVTGSTAPATAAPASLPLAIGIPAALLLLGAPIGTAVVRRRLGPRR